MGLKIFSAVLGLYELAIDSHNAALARLKDANGNDVAQVTNSKLAANQGVVMTGGVNDGSAVPLRVDRLGSIMVGGKVQKLFYHQYEGTVVDTIKFTATAANFVPTQSTANGLSFNASNLLNANSYALYISNRKFAKTSKQPLQLRARMRVTTGDRGISEIGFGTTSTTTAAVSDGAFWRINNAGLAIPVISNGASEVPGTSFDMLAYDAAYGTQYYIFDVIVDDDSAIFTVQDSDTGDILARTVIQVPSLWSRMWTVTHQSIFKRFYYTGGVAATTLGNLIVSDLVVLEHDLEVNRGPAELAAITGLASWQTPWNITGSANFTNSAAAANATLSNTAASYATPGGLAQFVAVAGAETDYALFAFTVPANTTMYVKGIRISGMNFGAATATTPTTLMFFAAPNGAAVSLATANLQRIALGHMSSKIGDVAGTPFDRDIDVKFNTPLVTEASRVFVIGMRIPTGSATASQVIRLTAMVDGWFE